MTENDAIRRIRYRIDTASEIAGKGAAESALEDMYIAISALKEIQQYREIGTVEEIKDLLVTISEASEEVDESGINVGFIKDLIQLGEYRKIGTVEECREAVEKQKEKKKIQPKTALERYYHEPQCPNCKRELMPKICGYTLAQAIGIYSYCPWCGQKIKME